MAVEAIGLKIFAEAKIPTKIGQLFPGGNIPGSFEKNDVQRLMLP
jgi:hypothetical protein